MALDPSEAAGIPDELIGMYSDAELALLAAMTQAIVQGIDTPEWEARQPQEMLLFRRQAEALAAQLQSQMPAMVAGAVAAAAERGRQAADSELDKIPSATPPTTSGVSGRTRSATQSAWHQLASVTQLLPSVAADLYGRVVAQVQVRDRAVPRRGGASGGVYGAPMTEGDRLQAVQQALDSLTKRGITGFRDARGRNWSLSSYVEMKSRTIVNQELIAAHTDRMLERGQSLIVVSSHKNPAPQCQPFEGQVLSLNGETGTVIRPSAVGGKGVKVKIKATLEQARAKGFQHPNCGHAVSAFVPGASRTFTTKPDPEGYKATQDQRRMEREIRDTKRQLATAATPQAKRELTAKLKAQQAVLKAHVAEHDLTRRPKRESITGAHRAEGQQPPDATPSPGGPRGPIPPDPPVRTGGGGGGDDGGDGGDGGDGWSGHTKGYVHPHRQPTWTEEERVLRQKSLGIDLHGEQLYQHEVEAVERLQALGHDLEWIARDTRLPTNDAIWKSNGGIEFDLKSTGAKYDAVKTHLKRSVIKARAQDVVKENFIIDLGPRGLSEKLRRQLSQYNERNPENKITGLWVLARGELVKVEQTE